MAFTACVIRTDPSEVAPPGADAVFAGPVLAAAPAVLCSVLPAVACAKATPGCPAASAPATRPARTTCFIGLPPVDGPSPKARPPVDGPRDRRRSGDTRTPPEQQTAFHQLKGLGLEAGTAGRSEKPRDRARLRDDTCCRARAGERISVRLLSRFATTGRRSAVAVTTSPECPSLEPLPAHSPSAQPSTSRRPELRPGARSAYS